MIHILKEGDKIGFLGRSYGTIGIFRNYTTPKKEIAISLIGPVVPFLIGLELYILGLIIEEQLLFSSSFFWLSHIVSLISDDGRNVKKGMADLIRKRRVKV